MIHTEKTKLLMTMDLLEIVLNDIKLEVEAHEQILKTIELLDSISMEY